MVVLSERYSISCSMEAISSRGMRDRLQRSDVKRKRRWHTTNLEDISLGVSLRVQVALGMEIEDEEEGEDAESVDALVNGERGAG